MAQDTRVPTNRETLNLKAGFDGGEAPICKKVFCYRCRHKTNERGGKTLI